MISPVRTIVDIPDQFIESLDRLGTTNHQSRAALIREAIADFLKVKSLPPSEAAFGIWKNRKMDGVEYQNELREEWEGR
jgi:predicted transcriptional regulator